MTFGRRLRAVPVAALAGAVLAACTAREPAPPQEVPGPPEPQATEPATFTLTPPPELSAGGTLALTRAGEAPLVETMAAVEAGAEADVVVAPREKVVATWVSPGGPPWARWLDPACPSEPARGGVGRRTLRVPQDHATIQAAIDAAGPGETVRVAPGVYTEHVRLRSGVRLVGSGARRTILDGGGSPIPLVVFSEARNAVLAGFTLRNVGRATGCATPDDPFACSGNWYSPAVYGDGHDTTTWGWPDGCATSIVIAHNVFEANHIALLGYFHARFVLRNNVFTGNEFGVVATHFQDSAVVESNVFWENRRLAIGSNAGYVDIVDNLVARSEVGIRHAYVQTGRIRCNAFFENGANAASDHGTRFVMGQDGNFELDPGLVDARGGDFHLAPGSALRDAGCFEGASRDPDGSRRDVGAYGGPLGGWTGE